MGAEERGQSEAIARNLREMSRLKVPVICTVIGEGGSGGALAIGVGDKGETSHAGYVRWLQTDRALPRPRLGKHPGCR